MIFGVNDNTNIDFDMDYKMSFIREVFLNILLWYNSSIVNSPRDSQQVKLIKQFYDLLEKDFGIITKRYVNRIQYNEEIVAFLDRIFDTVHPISLELRRKTFALFKLLEKDLIKKDPDYLLFYPEFSDIHFDVPTQEYSDTHFDVTTQDNSKIMRKRNYKRIEIPKNDVDLATNLEANMQYNNSIRDFLEENNIPKTLDINKRFEYLKIMSKLNELILKTGYLVKDMRKKLNPENENVSLQNLGMIVTLLGTSFVEYKSEMIDLFMASANLRQSIDNFLKTIVERLPQYSPKQRAKDIVNIPDNELFVDERLVTEVPNITVSYDYGDESHLFDYLK